MSMMKITCDRRAVEGVPLQMIVAVALVVMTIPPTLSAFESIQRQNSIGRVEEAVEHILLASRQIALSGDGGIRIIELNLDVEGLEYVRIGGKSTSDLERISASYKMRWSGEITRIHNPPVNMESADGNSLVLYRGITTLMFTACSFISEDGVRQRVVVVERAGGSAS